MKLNDLTGQKRGRFTVESIDPTRTKDRRVKWICICDCGTRFSTTARNIQSGNTRSCGCLRREISIEGLKARGQIGNALIQAAGTKASTKHGMHKTRTYHSWNSMKMRCLNPSSDSYPAYGGRGIKVCERWNSFEYFLADMGECPPGFSIERRDVNGDYEKDNCEWASVEVQQNNKRSNRFIEYQGKTLTAAQWERIFGLRHGTVLQRLRRGWPLEQVFEPPRTYAGGAS